MANLEEEVLHAQPIIQDEIQAQFTVHYAGNAYEFTASSVPGAFRLSVPNLLIAEGQDGLTATVNSAFHYPSIDYIVCFNNKKFTARDNEPITEDAIEEGEELPVEQLPENVSSIIDLMRNLVATSPGDFEVDLLANPVGIIDGFID